MSRTSFYVGNMLSSQECYALAPEGIPCGQPTIGHSPAPICERHARQLVGELSDAIERAQPACIRCGGECYVEGEREGSDGEVHDVMVLCPTCHGSGHRP